MKKLAIFDFDGTLADSMEIWQHACSILLKKEGVTPPAGIDEMLLPMSVTGTCEYLQQNFLPQYTVQQLLEKTDEIIFDWYNTQIVLKPGAVEYLTVLKNAGMHICVLSSTRREHLVRAIDRLGIAHFFEYIWGGTDTPAGKEVPAVFGWAAEHFGLTCNDCVVFEDSLYAIDSAGKAGCKTVAIDDVWTRGDKQKIMAACDVYMEHFDPAAALEQVQ